MDVCGLKDLGFRGSKFTWCRGNNPDNHIKDVRHLPIYKSDHSPILLKAGASPHEEGNTKPFKFESLWLSSDDCKKVVDDAWLACPDSNIQFRISECANNLAEWSKITFGVVRKKIKKAERSLSKLQNCAPDANVLRSCKVLSEELDTLHRLEESYWFMRARSNELRDGDKNTKYFHHKASSRRRRNTIKGLTDENGVWKSDSPTMQRIIADYFSHIFSLETPADSDTALSGLSRKVSEEMNEALDRAPSDTEIKDALFQRTQLKLLVPMVFMLSFSKLSGPQWVTMLFLL